MLLASADHIPANAFHPSAAFDPACCPNCDGDAMTWQVECVGDGGRVMEAGLRCDDCGYSEGGAGLSDEDGELEVDGPCYDDDRLPHEEPESIDSLMAAILARMDRHAARHAA